MLILSLLLGLIGNFTTQVKAESRPCPTGAGTTGDDWIEEITGFLFNPLYTVGGSEGGIYALGDDGNLYRTLNNGASWILVHSSVGKYPYVDSRDYVYIKSGDRLWRSTDQGDSWSSVLDVTNAGILWH